MESQFDQHPKLSGEVRIMAIHVTPDEDLVRECSEKGRGMESLFNKLDVMQLVRPEERAGYEALMECLRRNIREGIYRVNVQTRND